MGYLEQKEGGGEQTKDPNIGRKQLVRKKGGQNSRNYPIERHVVYNPK